MQCNAKIPQKNTDTEPGLITLLFSPLTNQPTNQSIKYRETNPIRFAPVPIYLYLPYLLNLPPTYLHNRQTTRSQTTRQTSKQRLCMYSTCTAHTSSPDSKLQGVQPASPPGTQLAQDSIPKACR